MGLFSGGGNINVVSGNANGAVLAAGNNIRIENHGDFSRLRLPDPQNVDMAATLQALREILTALPTPDQKKIHNALAEAADEMARPEQDRDEVGKALQRALEYAQKSGEFADRMEELVPHVKSAASWLGTAWHGLLNLVGTFAPP